MTAQPTITTIAGGNPADTLTVRHLRLRGSQRDIGAAMAAAAHAVHGDRAAPRPVPQRIERARRRWFAHHHPQHLARAQGAAAYLGIDPDDATVATDWLGTTDLPAGCSVAFVPGNRTDDGHGLLARNFDFPTATAAQLLGLPGHPDDRPMAADPWVIELHPDDGYASVTVGIIDLFGAMDGINEAGLAVALLADNETPDPEPTGGPRVGLAEHQVVRYLLDTCATVEDAEDALLAAKHYYFFTPCHFVVADRSGASFVWEHSPRRNHEIVVRTEADDATICTNHLLHRRPVGAPLPDDSGPIGTAARTYGRWRDLDVALRRQAVLDDITLDAAFGAVSFGAPLVEARTYWHARYDVDDASIAVAFHLRDVDGRSVRSEPWRAALRAEALV